MNIICNGDEVCFLSGKWLLPNKALRHYVNCSGRFGTTQCLHIQEYQLTGTTCIREAVPLRESGELDGSAVVSLTQLLTRQG
jgi:hypothetical protein